ncbi:hypothetical protein NDU88_005343 [Pleurodeles waltl]|uniref:Uncharacterized protein n=1 Tax=Pleurodeles waltl TaxID=8319 RepID=A0AAV7RNT8_PLEWA|nr:hypothetical protein NDU88_005343 [Pleurodeles waltl]
MSKVLPGHRQGPTLIALRPQPSFGLAFGGATPYLRNPLMRTSLGQRSGRVREAPQEECPVIANCRLSPGGKASSRIRGLTPAGR